MSHSARKFIAVLLAIWLPLFGASALATTISMQHGSCHEADMEAMQIAGDYHHTDQDKQPCENCGICQLACCCYLGVQEIRAQDMLQAAVSITPYLFSFHSLTSTPLVPPPLACA